MITSKEWRYWLRTLGHPQPERAPRRRPNGLAAMHGSVSAPKVGRIKIISKTGLFLQTRERWPIDHIVPLTLQKEGTEGARSEFYIDVSARVASYGDDGVGLGFVLPKGLDPALWEQVIEAADSPNESEDIQFMFRLVRAILFTYRVCPARSDEAVTQITGEMDEFRTGNMLAVANLAEKMLASRPHAKSLRAHPHIVASILKNGSWEKDDVVQRMGAGLLVSSCDECGDDQSNLDLIDLLEQVTANQVHILFECCRRAVATGLGSDGGAASPVILSNHEMIRITGIYDVYRNATDVAYLHNFGLIHRNFDFSTHASMTNFDVTPTPLGMRLYTNCLGFLIDHAMSTA